MGSALRRVPAWAWLGAIVLASLVVRAWLARGMLGPFIMVDELIYTELAKSLADAGSYAVRDVTTSGYGVVYPALLAPAYALFDSVPDVYAVVKTVNALVMSLAALPAYLIARRVVTLPSALLAALLAVALPSLVYTATVMTENVFYPLMLLWAWTLLLALERPSWGRAALVVGLVGVLFATRAQAAALVPAAATAPVLFSLAGGSGLRGLRDHLHLYALLGAAAVAVLAVQAGRGQGPRDLLGAYEVVGDRSYDTSTVLRFWAWHLEELTLYLAIVPVAAFLVLLASWRRLPRAQQALLAVTVSLVVWFSLVVAAFASQFANRIQERNLFFVAPLLFVSLLVWVERGAPRRPAVAWPAAALAIALPLLFPYARFIETGAISDTLALLPLWTINEHLLAGSYAATVALVAVPLGALFLLAPARYALALPLAVLVVYAVVAQPIWAGPRGFKQAGAGALFTGIRSVPRDWIDRAVPEGEQAAVVWTGRTDRFTVNENELFNRRLGRVYYTGEPTPGGLPETKVTISGDGVVRLPDGRPVTDRYVLLDGTIVPQGIAVTRDERLGLTLWRLAGPLVSARIRVTGLYPSDTWSRDTVRWVWQGCTGGTLAVALSSDPTLFPGIRQRVRATTRAGRDVNGVDVVFDTDGRATLRVPLRPSRGRCAVDFTVTPTAVPSQVLPGSQDDRLLGAHFDGFALEP